MSGHTSYRVAVEILAINSMSGVMRIISGDIMGLNKQIQGIGKGIGSWRTALLGVGTAMTALGASAIALEYRMAKVGDRLVQQQQLMRAAGISQSDMLRATSLSIQTSGSVAGATPSGVMALIMQLRDAMGDMNEAMQLAPRAAQAQFAMKEFHVPGFDTPEGMASILKALDIAGAGIKGGRFDPDALGNALHALTQFEVYTKGMLQPSEVLQIARQSGWTAQTMDFKDWLSGYGATFMEMGGRAGYGLSTDVMGMMSGRTSKDVADAWAEYGLIPHSAVHKGGRGGQGTGFDASKLLGRDEFLTQGLAAYSRDVILPALAKHGVTTRDAIITALSRLYGQQRGARVAMTFMTPAGQIIQSREETLAKQAFGGDSYQAALKTLQGNVDRLTASFTTLGEVATYHAIPQVISDIQGLNGVVAELSNWANAHPTTIPAIMKGLRDLGIGITALGTVMIGTAVLGMIGTGGSFALLSVAILGLADALGMVNWQGLQGLLSFLHMIGLYAGVAAPNAEDVTMAQQHTASGKLMFPGLANRIKTTTGGFDLHVQDRVPTSHVFNGGSPYALMPFNPLSALGVDPITGLSLDMSPTATAASAAMPVVTVRAPAWMKHAAPGDPAADAASSDEQMKARFYQGRAYRGAITPSTHATGGDHAAIPVVVTNLSAESIARAVVNGTAGSLLRNNAGAVHFNPNRGQTSPGLPTAPGALTRP